MKMIEIAEQTGVNVKILEKHLKKHPESFQKVVVEQLEKLPKIDFDNFVPKGLWVKLDEHRMICEEGLLLQTKNSHSMQKEVGTIYRPPPAIMGGNRGNRLETYRKIWYNGKVCRFPRVLWEVFNGEIDKNKVIDHINENSIDDRLDNYQEIPQRRNIAKGIKYRGNASSKYTGVCWHKAHKKWKAQIHINGKRHHLGLFTDEIEAAKAWDERARKEDLPENEMNFPKQSTVPEKLCEIVT